MQKKWIWGAVLALILVAVVLCVVFWRQSPPAVVYTNEQLGYSFAVPEGGKVVDDENGQSILDEMPEELAANDQAKAVIEQAKTLPITFILFTTEQEQAFIDNINVVTQDLGQTLTTEELLSLSATLDAQYQTMFQDFRLVSPCEIKTFGKRQVMQLHAEYVLMGVDLTICQGFFMEGSVMYNVTLTCRREQFADCYAKLGSVLSTLQVVKK